ncbi:MAG TPA: DNA polymerase Y family protein, partial [Acidiferrobacterales bacterium]
MLWLCLHLPDLALDVCTRGAPESGPVAVSTGSGRAQRILAANAAARSHGVQAGMALNAAQACVAMLRVTAHDAQAEREALARLAAWAGQYTPVVSLAPPQALLLEVAGSRRLFGGDSNLREQVRQGLAELGFTARSALAPTPLAALWLARAGGEARVTRTAQLAAALAPLPLAALEPDARQGALLAAMGLGRLGDCLR